MATIEHAAASPETVTAWKNSLRRMTPHQPPAYVAIITGALRIGRALTECVAAMQVMAMTPHGRAAIAAAAKAEEEAVREQLRNRSALLPISRPSAVNFGRCRRRAQWKDETNKRGRGR